MFGGHGPSLSGVVGKRRSSTASSRHSEDGVDPNEEDTTVVNEGEKNILLSIISQLRPGADLSRITFPTFILEPRSMLDRITNFMQHPENLLPLTTIDDPVQRFVAVVKFYLSGWHLKPPGVKKPLNPILGETFTCWWDFPDNTKAYYISEQTSHHPPKSSYFYMAPHQQIRIDGTLKPRSRFLGNSAASMMEGIAVLNLMNKGKNGGEKYTLTQPNIYVRGILFGAMKYELGDHSYVKCEENNLVADIEFRTKGFFTGTYNAIYGTIKRGNELLYEINGKWNEDMHIKDVVNGQTTLLFDASSAKPSLPQTRSLEEQDERESQKLWNPTVSALNKRDQDKATEEKARIEDRQREEARNREADGIEWQPRLFKPTNEFGLDYILSTPIDAPDAESQIKQILAITPILPGSAPSSKYPIPRRNTQQLQQEQENPSPQQQQQPPTQGQQNSTPYQTPVGQQFQGQQSRTNSVSQESGQQSRQGSVSSVQGQPQQAQPRTSSLSEVMSPQISTGSAPSTRPGSSGGDGSGSKHGLHAISEKVKKVLP